MQQSLIILKPSAIERGLMGEIITRFEKKGLLITGMKMIQLTDNLLNEHYAHLATLPIFSAIKDSMKRTPVVVMCLEGKECVDVVRLMVGPTNSRTAAPGTIRGDLSVSMRENIIHASDSDENAAIEINRFFAPDELFMYQLINTPVIYAPNELT